MSIFVFTENWDGKFKKLSHELVSYGAAMAKETGTTVTALSIGKVDSSELEQLSRFGADKVLTIEDSRFTSMDNRAMSRAIVNAAQAEGAQTILLAHNNLGKALAPRIAVRMNAALETGVIALPVSFDPFVVKKKVFTGKAIAEVVLQADNKVFTLAQNSFEPVEENKPSVVVAYNPQLDDSLFSIKVNETKKVTGQVLLSDAEIVVSGGRGMKGPENWGGLEELAELLGAGMACSRPVSDEGWRSHNEHVGQTGKIIAPNLYFAFGISGAIQHLGGVSSSKVIVAVNKDPEAPIFEAADYGIVGDVFTVIPQFIEAVKKM